MYYFFCNLKDANAKNAQDRLDNPKASDVPKVPKDDSGMNSALKAGLFVKCLV